MQPILNDAPSFGFASEETAETMARLFRARSSLSDHLNFDLIKFSNQGYHQVEERRKAGVPRKVLQSLDTCDIAALYIGIQLLKGRFVRDRKEDLIGAPFGTLLASIVSAAYDFSERRNPTKNAVRAMKQMKIGFSGHQERPFSIAERMDSLEESVQLQFLRSFYTDRRYSQEEKHDAHFYDYVFAQFHYPEDGRPIDSDASRRAYADALIVLIREKEVREDDFSKEDFVGKIATSTTHEGKRYFVQRNEVPQPSGFPKQEYACSCPYGYRKMYGHNVSGAECKHIKSFKEQLLEEESKEKRVKALRQGKGQLRLIL